MALAVLVVGTVIYIAPAVGVGTIAGGAGLGLLTTPFVCDQTDNGFIRPSLDLDPSCVATEVALGAVFAPLGAGTSTLGRAVAVGCAEGATSTVAYGYAQADTDLNAANVAIGTALGCITGGSIQAGVNAVASRGLFSTTVQRLSTRADDIRSELLDTPFAIAGSRNVAVAEYWIDGTAADLVGVSGLALRPGTVNPPTQPVFAAFEVDFDRGLDAEYKILEEIAARIGPARELSGVVHIYSELPICLSCNSVIEQFQNRYGIEVIVATGAP